jgi:hypothetical protein
LNTGDAAKLIFRRATLTNGFHDGSVYEYYAVQYVNYTGLLNAPSPGHYFHAHIRDRYRYRRVS